MAAGPRAKDQFNRLTNLVRLLQSSEPELRRSTAHLLAGEKHRDAIDALCQALSDPVAEVRLSVAHALQHQTATYATQQIIARLQDKSGAVREAAAIALRNNDSIVARDALSLSLFDEVPSVGLAAAHSLQSKLDSSGTEKLLSVLVSDSMRARLAAAVALQGHQDKLVVVKLVDLALHSHSPDQREAAVHALKGTTHPIGTEGLIRSLKDASALVRIRALHSLHGNQSPEVLDAVYPLLRDRIGRVRTEACQIFTGVPSICIQQDLAEQAANDDSAEVRRACCLALDGTSCREARDALVSVLDGDPEPYVRESAARALRTPQIAREEQVFVERMMCDPAILVREACASIGPAKLSGRVIEALCRVALYDSAASVRVSAIDSLHGVRDAWAQGCLMRLGLSEMWSECAPAIRCASLRAIGSLKVKGIIPELMKLAENARISDVRRAALEAAIANLPHANLEEIFRLWDRADEDMRIMLVPHLARSRASKAFEQLTRAITKDSSWKVRLRAIEELAREQDRASLMVMVEALRDSNSVVSERAAECLRGCTDGHVLGLLLLGLKEGNARYRYYCAHALRGVNNGQAITSIVELCNHTDSHIRQSAVIALSKTHDWRAREALTGALRDRDRSVRSFAQQALKSSSLMMQGGPVLASDKGLQRS